VHVDPEIVLIDEVLAVGDIAFQHQCLRRIKEMQQQGRIFICASHVAESLADICQNAIWLEQGSLVANGGLMEVAEEYRRRYEYTTEISIPEAHTAG
jgi:ABC-type polysaccharide/polyol phosphate transport system ATPase subunit